MRMSILMLILILAGNLAEKQKFYQNKIIKIVMLSFKQRFDTKHIAYFNQSTQNPDIYYFKILEAASTLFLSLDITDLDKKRSVFNLRDLNVCLLLRNPLFNRAIYNFKEQLFGNQSLQCPIQRGVYYFSTALDNKSLPPVYSSGKFQAILRFTDKPRGKVSLEVQWVYRIFKL